MNGRDDKRSLLRYALATASIYGICGYGPSGPAPKFAGANFANAGAVRYYGKVEKNGSLLVSFLVKTNYMIKGGLR